MTTEFGKDELLAQAILDLELKMKHEIRQNNAYLLSKIEKHYEQTDKKLTFLEAKMEAMSREREDRQQPHNRGGRRTNYFATNNFAPNNPGGRAQMFGVEGRRTSGAVPPNIPNQHQQQNPYKVFGVGSSGSTATNRQFKPNTEKPMGDGHGHGGRHKQTLGTNKAQVASPSTIQNQWTTKAAGMYTDEEDSSDSSVESRKSDVKHLLATSQKELEGQVQKGDEQEQPPAQIVEEQSDGTAVFEETVNEVKVFVDIETREEAAGISDGQPKPTMETLKETTDNESLATACTSAVAMMLNIKENHQSMSTVTPGATISPVIGGFGRRRK